MLHFGIYGSELGIIGYLQVFCFLFISKHVGHD